VYVNGSTDGQKDVRGPWNEGQGPWPKGEEWVYVADPIQHVLQTNGMLDQKIEGTKMTMAAAQRMDKELSQKRGKVVKDAVKKNPGQWSEYDI
jgi:Mn-containing catalase